MQGGLAIRVLKIDIYLILFNEHAGQGFRARWVGVKVGKQDVKQTGPVAVHNPAVRVMKSNQVWS